jgi:hypothetical protein
MPRSQSRQCHQFYRLALKTLGVLALIGALGCDHPEIKKYQAPREKAGPDFTRLESYQLPDGWKRLHQPVELSVASFEAGKGDKTVIVTVSRFPGKAGGLAANVNRWRGKVGLSPIEEEQINKELQWLQVDGEKTPYLDLANANKSGSDRILGVIADRGSVTWFFKLQGPPEQVDDQKAAFESFIKSVKFGGTGAKDE